jgi:hypothetical protein
VNKGKRKAQGVVAPLTSTERESDIAKSPCAAFALFYVEHVWVSSAPSLTHLAVDVDGGAYEGEVGQGLGEIAEGLAAGRDLLGVEP